MHSFNSILAVFLLLALSSCSFESGTVTGGNQELYTSADFTDSLFTSGIEGPAVDKKGNLYAVNLAKEGTIGIVDSTGAGKIYFTLPAGSIGNGIRFNGNGDMFVADYTGHNILKISASTNSIVIFAHNDSMNQPNDLAIAKNGIIYASDPSWSTSTGKLWMIDLQGTSHLLEDSMGTTNGIEVGTGDTVFYVNESIQKNVWAYTLSSDGKISNKRLHIKFDDYGMDGMRCDKQGNLYIARYDKGTIAIVSPQGKLIREVSLKGKKPTNIAFGGPDGKTCYVTLQDRGIIEMFRNEFPGREFQLFK